MGCDTGHLRLRFQTRSVNGFELAPRSLWSHFILKDANPFFHVVLSFWKYNSHSIIKDYPLNSIMADIYFSPSGFGPQHGYGYGS